MADKAHPPWKWWFWGVVALGGVGFGLALVLASCDSGDSAAPAPPPTPPPTPAPAPAPAASGAEKPFKDCTSMEPAGAERESSASFEVKKVGGVVVSPRFPAETGQEVLVTHDGAVHLFVYPLSRGGALLDYSLDQEVNYWKFHGGSWTDFGVIAGGKGYGLGGYHDIGTVKAVEMPDGLLFLVVSGLRGTREEPRDRGGEFFIGQGREWKQVAGEGFPSSNLAALADGSGSVHILGEGGPGDLREKARTDGEWVWRVGRLASHLNHSFLVDGGMGLEQVTQGYSSYVIENIHAALAPDGSLYATFRMSGVVWGGPWEQKYGRHPPAPTLCVSVLREGSWEGPFGLLDSETLLELSPFLREKEDDWWKLGGPFIAVDDQGLCHLLWESVYLQFRDGECSEPWVVLKGAIVKGMFHDAHGRLVVFLAHEGKLVARIREERGWSKPCLVVETDQACPVRGSDGSLYVLWREPVDEYTARASLQRLAFEEIHTTAPSAE